MRFIEKIRTKVNEFNASHKDIRIVLNEEDNCAIVEVPVSNGWKKIKIFDEYDVISYGIGGVEIIINSREYRDLSKIINKGFKK